MKGKLEKRRQELRTEEAILSALPAGTDLGIVTAALAELLLENVRLMTKGHKVAGGAPGPLLLRDAAALLADANVLMGAVARAVAWDSEWEERALAWGAQFAGWEARYARHGMVTIDRDGIVLAVDAGGEAVGELVSVAQDGQVIVKLGGDAGRGNE